MKVSFREPWAWPATKMKFQRTYTHSFPIIGVGICVIALAFGHGIAVTTTTLYAAEPQIVLKEHLGQKWSAELLTYPFHADLAQRCCRESIGVSLKGNSLPAQLIDVEFWPGTEWVKKAKLTFVADLGPLQERVYTVHSGNALTEPPATDLRTSHGPNGVEITTNRFGLRLLSGEKVWDCPASSQDVPGPVLAMRLADGTWFGASRLYGGGRVKRYSARLLESGPVVATWSARYMYDNGATLTISVKLAVGDCQAVWETDYRGNDPGNGWKLVLSRGLDPLLLQFVPEFEKNKWGKFWFNHKTGQWVDEAADVLLQKEPTGVITSLRPWNDWWDGTTQTSWVLKTSPEKKVLQVKSVEPGAWVDPEPPGTFASLDKWRPKAVPLYHEADGQITMRVSNAAGIRKWTLGAIGKPLGYELNVVKDYVLQWPEKPGSHPHLFLDRRELERVRQSKLDRKQLEGLIKSADHAITRPEWRDGYAVGAWLMSGSPEVAGRVKLVERLRKYMGLLGQFDRMRNSIALCCLYDAVMGSELISAQDRRLFRAQMAYLGYQQADPATWSVERGFTYTLNMGISNVLNQGVIASTIPDHPMADRWVNSATGLVERLLSEKVGPAGEWPESVSNYVQVSASTLLSFVIPARNAGFVDFVADTRFKRLLGYMARQYTPPDPRGGGPQRRAGLSGLSPLGRAGAGGRNGLAGVMARATLQDDPDYSAVQQWIWLRTGANRSIPDNRLGGWEYVYLDPQLPAQRPQWEFDYFPRIGAILRHGLGTPQEWYVYLMVQLVDGGEKYPLSNFYPSESGGFPAIFARGTPISARFAGGYAEREELLISRVLPARQRGTNQERMDHFCHDSRRRITAFSTLPRQHYVCGEFTIDEPIHLSHETMAHNKMRPLPQWPPVEKEGEPGIDWKRQVLMMRADEPAGVGYLVLRDTVSGGQPTMWQFWTVSQRIGTPQQTIDRQAFLAGAPGKESVDAYRLPPGQRYTALGQFDLDVEFYVAQPTNTPRHALRWGRTYDYWPINGFAEYQDMLHLQRSDDGVYFVIIFPRKPGEEIPEFTTFTDGKIVKLSGSFGNDYCFLSGAEAEAKVEEVAFRGTVASVTDRLNGNRRDGPFLCLGAGGEVSFKNYALRSTEAVSLRVNERSLAVDVSAGHDGVTLSFTVPGSWNLQTRTEGVALADDTDARRYTLTVPEGVTSVTLVPR